MMTTMIHVVRNWWWWWWWLVVIFVLIHGDDGGIGLDVVESWLLSSHTTTTTTTTRTVLLLLGGAHQQQQQIRHHRYQQHPPPHSVGSNYEFDQQGRTRRIRRSNRSTHRCHKHFGITDSWRRPPQRNSSSQSSSQSLLWLSSSSPDEDLDQQTTTTTATTTTSSSSSGGGVEEYRNGVTKFLSNFMKKNEGTKKGGDHDDPLGHIDFSTIGILPQPLANMMNEINSKKKEEEEEDTAISSSSSSLLLDEYMMIIAQCLDSELYTKKWFVTGNVNPIYFSKNYIFEDPDVTLNGIENYSRSVYKLFEQDISDAQIISTNVTNNTNQMNTTITTTWRLSGRANIGPTGINIKPYIVYTDHIVDHETGLIMKQIDRFDIPSWDILLSSIFPFLIGIITAKPTPSIQPRPNGPPQMPI